MSTSLTLKAAKCASFMRYVTQTARGNGRSGGDDYRVQTPAICAFLSSSADNICSLVAVNSTSWTLTHTTKTISSARRLPPVSYNFERGLGRNGTPNRIPRRTRGRRRRIGYGFPHRFAEAFLAICLRLAGESFLALAFPPFFPPSRPKATAAGFLPASGSGISTCPVVTSTMNLAGWLVRGGASLCRWSFRQPPWDGYCELESRKKKGYQRHNRQCQKPFASHGSHHAINGEAKARLWISNCNSTGFFNE